MNSIKIIKESNTSQKGITLISLVITIIVLLILAGVTISMVLGDDGIINKATSAGETYEESRQNEMDILKSYELAAASVGKEWTQNGTTVSRGDVTLKVGQVVNFNSEISSYESIIASEPGLEWKVLGADDGYLLLLSGSGVGLGKDENGEYNGEHINGTIGPFTIESSKDGKNFVEQMKELDKICAPYGKGEQAAYARCITVEDINRITGYNPNKTGTGYPYGVQGGDDDKTVSDYGMKVTYKFNNDNKVEYTFVNYKGEVETGIKEENNKFYKIGENTNAPELFTSEGFTATCDAYTYYLKTLTSRGTDAQNGITDSDIYNMLKGIGKGYASSYFLNNLATRTRQGAVLYSARRVAHGEDGSDGYAMVSTVHLWQTEIEKNERIAQSIVRAVVYVNPNYNVNAATGDLVLAK